MGFLKLSTFVTDINGIEPAHNRARATRPYNLSKKGFLPLDERGDCIGNQDIITKNPKLNCSLAFSAVRAATQIDSAALFNPGVSIFSFNNNIDGPPQLTIKKYRAGIYQFKRRMSTEV